MEPVNPSQVYFHPTQSLKNTVLFGLVGIYGRRSPQQKLTYFSCLFKALMMHDWPMLRTMIRGAMAQQVPSLQAGNRIRSLIECVAHMRASFDLQRFMQSLGMIAFFI